MLSLNRSRRCKDETRISQETQLCCDIRSEIHRGFMAEISQKCTARLFPCYTSVRFSAFSYPRTSSEAFGMGAEALMLLPFFFWLTDRF